MRLHDMSEVRTRSNTVTLCSLPRTSCSCNNFAAGCCRALRHWSLGTPQIILCHVKAHDSQCTLRRRGRCCQEFDSQRTMLVKNVALAVMWRRTFREVFSGTSFYVRSPWPVSTLTCNDDSLYGTSSVEMGRSHMVLHWHSGAFCR